MSLSFLIDGSLAQLAYTGIQDWQKTSAGSHLVRGGVFDGAVDRRLLRHLSVLTNGKRIPPIDQGNCGIYTTSSVS